MNYIRFFHVETHHFPFIAIEVVVTVAGLLFFLLLPERYLAFFPGQEFRRFAQKRLRACAVIFLLCLFGRIALLPIEPFPVPNVHDEFSFLLGSDTFAHGRITNPTPALWRHFEAFHVLMQPTFMTKYGAAQPLFMAFGQRFLRSPRAGILLSTALALASLCWMLQAYLPAEWAFLGGLLAVVRVGWFSYFGNTYWGGSVAILGGCLLLGAAARLSRKPRTRYGLLIALGLVLLANSRPFEGAMISLPICLSTLWFLVRKRAPVRVWLPGVALLLAGAICTAYYCHRVTGRFTFPWTAQWEQGGMCPPFLFGKPNYSVHYRFSDLLRYNKYADTAPYTNLKTTSDLFALQTVKGLNQWMFFIFPALTLPFLVGLGATLRARKSRVLVCAFGFACLGFLSQTWLQAHYFAVAVGVVYLVLLNGMRCMLAGARRNILWLGLLRGTLAVVLVMFLVRLIVVPVGSYPPDWGSQMGGIPGYADLTRIMNAKAGRQLVLVHYREDHFWGFSWINNGYDIPTQHVVWARDTEPEESNLPLLCALQDRQVWLLVPPEEGFMPPPDRTAPWDANAAEGFLRPYVVSRPLDCRGQQRSSP